tara:strand:+ start:846 stop:1874 length:1029 start_codon:yes stop_codon:yes gene_type:complete
MKSLILKEPGQSPDIRVFDVPEPILTADGVIIKVAAAGLCHHDISVMDGTLRRGTKTDVILGHEISGTVVDIGNKIRKFRLGDQVVTTLTASCGECVSCVSGGDYMCEFALGYGHGIDGGFAEYILVQEKNLVNVGNLDLVQSALLSCPIGVCIKALIDKGSLGIDDSCVVFGSGGGLGIHALQVAQTYTSNVTGFTSSPNKLEEIGKYGVSPTFLLDESLDPTDLVMALTEDKGADVIFNSVGSKFLKSSVSSLSYGGRVLMMGELLGRNGSLNTADLLFKNGSVIGSTGASKPHIQSAINMVKDGNVVPVVGGIFPLEDIQEAFHLMKNKASVGRLVLIP